VVLIIVTSTAISLQLGHRSCEVLTSDSDKESVIDNLVRPTDIRFIFFELVEKNEKTIFCIFHKNTRKNYY